MAEGLTDNLIVVTIDHPRNRYFDSTQKNRKALSQNDCMTLDGNQITFFWAYEEWSGRLSWGKLDQIYSWCWREDVCCPCKASLLPFFIVYNVHARWYCVAASPSRPWHYGDRVREEHRHPSEKDPPPKPRWPQLGEIRGETERSSLEPWAACR